MTDITTRLGSPDDAPEIARMLTLLADDLGDAAVFSSTPDIIRQHGFGAKALFHTVIAESDVPVGLALFFPHFSTTRGQPGAYVQDLWVDQTQRGLNIGRVLLRAVAQYSAITWQAGYIALSVHANNAGAARFYDRLGFDAPVTDRPMVLQGAKFRNLMQGETS